MAWVHPVVSFPLRSFLLKPKYKYTVPLCKKILETIDKMELVYVLQEDSRNDR